MPDTLYRVEQRRDKRGWDVNEYLVYDDGRSRFVQTVHTDRMERAAQIMCDAKNTEQDRANNKDKETG